MEGAKLIAWNLRKHRVARGLSQEALAVDARIDRTYISSLERASVNPTVSILDRLAEALSIPIAQLFRVPMRGEKVPSALPSGRHANSK